MERIAVKLGLWLSLLVSCALGPLLPSHAQPGATLANGDTQRILVLHGVWASEFWEWDFDRQFHERLDQRGAAAVEVSSIYLGIAQNPSPESIARQLRNIEALIEEQNVDLVVAVLPPAISFLDQLNLPSRIPVVMVMPDESALPVLGSRQVAVVPSAWRTIITETLEQIITLLPGVTDIEVIAGNGPGDLSYLERFQEIAANFAGRLSFNYTSGIPRDDLLETVASLPDTSAVVALPYESSGADYTQELPESLGRLTDNSSVPVFGIFDSQLPFGIAGGHLSSARDYASLAVDHSLALLGGQTPNSNTSQASTIYNWDRVRQWDLPVERLGGNVEMLGQPGTFFSDYPFAATLFLNTIILLLLGLGFIAYRYRRLQQARALIAASERKVRESEERYRLVTNNVADIIWAWEEGSDYLRFVSPAIHRVTGYTVTEYLALTIREMMSKDDYQVLARAYSEPGTTMVTRQIQLNHRNGHRVWVEMMVQATSSLENGKREWVGVSRDITQRKQSELERKNLEDQVRQAQKFESLGTLAGGIAHDFNNILTVIFGITDMLKLKTTDEHSRTLLLDRLQKASEKARSLVQQILTFSRQSKGEKSVIELNTLLNSSVGLLQSGKPENAELEVELYHEDLPLLANSNQLEQVIINLVANAFEAIAGNPGVIHLQTYAKTLASASSLTHGQLAAGNYVCLRVMDNGTGMDRDELSRAFDPFYTSKELGSGMGLAIVHGIIMNHGGGINIDSQPGLGTTIEVMLPASEESVITASSESAVAADKTETKRIIVVDDQEELLQVIADMLEQLGHQCITCKDPRQALDLIQQRASELDLIITDYSMPEMNGVELMQYCQQHCPDIPVVISTGYGDFTNRYSSQTLDRICILDKPYDLAKLREVVNNAA